jgi:nucleoside-diphosphate-sugar epimerase
MSAHIVFGTGPLGRATAAALLARGEQSTLANRRGTMPAPPAGTTVITLDLTDTAAAITACRGASALYICAQPRYHRWPKEFPAVIDAAIRIAEATGARLVVADNLYGYGPVAGAMTETLPLRPNTAKGRVRAAMHLTLEAAQSAGRITFAAARGSDFFGRWVEKSAVGSRLFDAIAKGKTAELMGNPEQPHSYTFVNDFGTALAILGTDPRGVGRAWHVPNAPVITSRRFVEIAFRLAGHSPRIRAVSRLELRLIGLFVPAVREGIEMLYEFEQPFVVDHTAFASTFGDISTPIESALEQTLAWIKDPHG